MNKPKTVFCFGVALAVIVWFTRPAAASIVLNQLDDFEDGTTMNWTGGASPTNVTTGGPAGANDNYLSITSHGGSGPGSRLATYNNVQWAGNFSSANVTSIDADFRNFSGSTVQLRILFFGSGGNFASTTAIPVVNDGLWHHVVFGVAAGDLTAVDGANPGDVGLTLGDVTQMFIRHQPGAPGGQGDIQSFAGELGIDNVSATPEPATLGLLVLGGLAMWRRRR